MTRPARFTRARRCPVRRRRPWRRPAAAGPGAKRGQARGLVDQAVAEINAAIASRQSEAALLNDFQRIFERYADTAYTGGLCAGRRRAQRQQCPENPPLPRPSAITCRANTAGGSANSSAARSSSTIPGPEDSFMEVRCTTVLRGEPPFQTDFWVSEPARAAGVLQPDHRGREHAAVGTDRDRRHAGPARG